MSGGVELSNLAGFEDLTGKVNKVMEKFKVDKETAGEIIEWATGLAMEKMEKWVHNMRNRQRERAEEIYQLIKRLKKEDKDNLPIINEIEKKILEMCVEE